MGLTLYPSGRPGNPRTCTGNPGGFIFVLIIAAFLLHSCSTSDQSPSDLGALTFTLNLPAQEEQEPLYKAAGFPCDQYNISQVEAQVWDAAGQLVASGGPWDCGTGRGTIPEIRAGDNYTLLISLLDSDGDVRYRGTKGGLRVRMGRVTNAGGIDLQRINFTPVFEEVESQHVRAGQDLSFSVSATDPDGDAVTYAAVSLPKGASFDPVGRIFSWTPGNTQTGTYTVRFQVVDDASTPLSEFLDVIIFVTGPNQAPVFEAVTRQKVMEGRTLSFTVSASDTDNDMVTYRAVSLPRGAAFDPASGRFSWRPGYDQAGSYTARFEAVDSSNPPQSATLDVPILVYNANRPPVVSAPALTQRVSVSGTLEFMVTATDPDGDQVTMSVANLPRNASGVYYPGVSFDPATGTFRWVAPGSSAIGEYTVLFIAVDSGSPAKRIYRYVTIQVYDPDDPVPPHWSHPVLSPIGAKQVDPGGTLQFTVSATDADYPDQGLSALVFSTEPVPGRTVPAGFTFDPSTLLFSWHPLAEGNYWIRFVVTDPFDLPLPLSDQEDVLITVGDVNRPPVLEPIGHRVVRIKETIRFTIYASDPDGDQLTFFAQNLPPGAAFDVATRTFSWTPSLTNAATAYKCYPPPSPVRYTVRFMVTDSGTPQEMDFEDVDITVLFN